AVPFPVRLARLSVEDVVGRDVAEPGSGETASFGDVPCPKGVDAEGAVRVELAAVDVGPRPGVDYGVGLEPGDGLEHRVPVADVELGVCRRDHVVVAEGLHQVTTQLAPGARHQDSQPLSRPSRVPTTSGSA